MMEGSVGTEQWGRKREEFTSAGEKDFDQEERVISEAVLVIL